MIKHIFCFLAGALLLTACTSDDLINETTPCATASVRLHLGGSAKASTTSRAGTITAEDNETAVNTLHAILFDTHSGFAGVVEARPSGADGQYDVAIEKDATYDIWFVANADAPLLEALSSISAETEAADARMCLQEIYSSHMPEPTEALLMLSNKLKRVTTTITQTEDLGIVEMVRLAARFDIVNQAEGVTVTKISFRNRAVKTALIKPNYMPQEENWFETTEYEPQNLIGNKDPEAATAFRHEIYSYRNTSMDADSVPVITIEYTENDDNSETVNRKHEIRLTDPQSPAGTPLAITDNKLYTITLTKAYKLNFTLEVSDWNEYEEINIRDLPVDLPKDIQDSLNRQLLVYDLFAQNYVNTLNSENGRTTATLFDKFLPANEYPVESYLSWSALDSKGLCGNDEKSYIYVDDVPYQIPTLGQLQLLTVYPVPIQDSIPTIFPVFGTGYKMYDEPFDEIVYLKNGSDFTPLITDDFSDESTAFKGTSQLLLSNEIFTLYQKKIIVGSKEVSINCSQDEGTITLNRRPCYGVRFKGTNQCAAYKWQYGFTDDGQSYYSSIKIKALPNKGEGIEVYDIADNVAFWKEGTYIEVNIPMSGDYFFSSSPGLSNVSSSYLNTKTKYSANTYLYFSLSSAQAYIGRTSTSVGFPLLLAKVKQQTED